MAAKKKRKHRSSLAPWLTVLFGLAVAAFAAFVLLSRDEPGATASFADLTDTPEAETNHDRDQIDQASRDQLRKILRAADRGE